MMAFGAGPVSVNLPPCRLAPRAFKTISDGTIAGLAWPMVFCSGTCGDTGAPVCADANDDVQNSAAAVVTMQAVKFIVIMPTPLRVTDVLLSEMLQRSTARLPPTLREGLSL